MLAGITFSISSVGSTTGENRKTGIFNDWQHFEEREGGNSNPENDVIYDA